MSNPVSDETTRVEEGSARPEAGAVRRRPLVRSFRTPLWHRVAEKAIAVMAMSAIVAILLIFLFIAREAVPMFWEQAFRAEVDLRDLFLPTQWPGYDESRYIWQPVGTPPKFNVVPLFVGTLKVTFLAMLLSVPMGIGSAVFLSQYAPRKVRELVKPTIELLAAVPSVVLGFFALMVVASWTDAAFGFTFRLNAIVAAIGLSFAIVPIIFTISEDALQSVPRPLNDAALALGARKYQMTLRVIVPSALPGIAASVILGFGRAIGETMIVLMASGNAALMEVFDPTTSVKTVTATIAEELGETAQGDPHWRLLFLLGVMLFAVTFVLNLGGRAAVNRLQKKFTAER